jgi:hypothetical protein
VRSIRTPKGLGATIGFLLVMPGTVYKEG